MVQSQIIYLDNNATTRCAAEVLDAMLPYLSQEYGNAASPHVLGRHAAKAVANAREQIAKCLECDASEVLFTSGATEANNLVLLGLSCRDGSRKKLVTSAIEHKSVLEPLSHLAERGFTTVHLPVSANGLVELGAAEEAIDENTLLVSVQAANNEVGTLQPIAELASMAHRHGAVMHCDAAQLLGKLPVSVVNLGADFISFSSHKAYGPKGAGILVASRALGARYLPPVFFGGGQEEGVRPGTLNVPGIVGTGAACEICRSLILRDQARIAAFRDELEIRLLERLPFISFACSPALRLPGTTTMLVPDVPADLLVSRLPNVCMGVGSACSSGAMGPSHVLLALGYSRDDARTAVRLSLGRYNSHQDVEAAVSAIATSVDAIRSEVLSACHQKGVAQ